MLAPFKFSSSSEITDFAGVARGTTSAGRTIVSLLLLRVGEGD